MWNGKIINNKHIIPHVGLSNAVEKCIGAVNIQSLLYTSIFQARLSTFANIAFGTVIRKIRSYDSQN